VTDQLQPPTADQEQAAREAQEREAFERAVQEEVARREAANRDRAQQTAAEREQAAREAADQYPQRGYQGPPPWEIAAVHGDESHDLKIDPRTNTPTGAPVPYTGPAAVVHDEPLLTYGSAGPEVERLVGLLARLGYADTREPLAAAAQVFDNSVMANVQRFQSEHGVSESLDQFQGLNVPAATLVEHHVGPYTWQALYDLA
jgi:hypothetical protein